MVNENEKEYGEEAEEFEVVELEADSGESEEFVIIDRIQIKKKEYAIMALLEDVRNMETMSEDEFEEAYGEDSIFVLMRQDNEAFIELSDEEYDSIKDELSTQIADKSDES